MYDEDDYLLLSGIQHFIFCRRQWALIHIEHQWSENVHTVEGGFFHEKAHSAARERRGEVIITRGMPVVSRELGITGACDVVELHEDKRGVPIHGERGLYRAVPIEYKRGKPKEHNADELQLCAQAMCLEEMLVCEIDTGYLFYGETKRRVEVPLTPELRAAVRDGFMEMYGYFKRGYTPKAKRSKGCKVCSLADICLPDMFRGGTVEGYVRASVGEAAIGGIGSGAFGAGVNDDGDVKP